MTDYPTKDSGAREQFDSGMVRDTQDGKPRFDLIIPLGLPYDEQMLTRLAKLMARGAAKYGDRNWEKAEGVEELDRARASAFRHFMQWLTGEHDEDHAAAAWFNMAEAELIEWKLANQAGATAEDGLDALPVVPIELWPTTAPVADALLGPEYRPNPYRVSEAKTARSGGGTIREAGPYRVREAA